MVQFRFRLGAFRCATNVLHHGAEINGMSGKAGHTPDRRSARRCNGKWPVGPEAQRTV